MDGGVIDEHTSLGHHLFDVAQAQRVGCVPANAHQHHLQRIVHPLDYLAQCLDHQHHPVVRLGSAYQHRLIATEPIELLMNRLRLAALAGRLDERWLQSVNASLQAPGGR